jgi:hypothetical protein
MKKQPKVGDYVVFGKRHKSLAQLEKFLDDDWHRVVIRWLKSNRRQKVKYSALSIPTPLQLLALQAE